MIQELKKIYLEFYQELIMAKKLAVIDGSLAYQIDHDEPKNEEEVDLFSEFLQFAQECC